MRGKKGLIVFLILLISGFYRTTPNFAGFRLLKPGMQDNRVAQIQSWLKILGYLDSEATGYYGPMTARAVFAFQRAERLNVDGLVGKETLARLCSRFREQSNTKPTPYSKEIVELLPWEKVKEVFPVGEVAEVVDLETGFSFKVYRHGGSLHADCEPYSSNDTAILFALYEGEWSWERRAALLLIGSHYIAASINGMPHGRCSIKNNHFPGHFCIHFYESRLHKNGKIDPTHQLMVSKAAGLTGA